MAISTAQVTVRTGLYLILGAREQAECTELERHTNQDPGRIDLRRAESQEFSARPDVDVYETVGHNHARLPSVCLPRHSVSGGLHPGKIELGCCLLIAYVLGKHRCGFIILDRHDLQFLRQGNHRDS